MQGCQLSLDESLPAGMRRIARVLVDGAIASSTTTGDPGSAIHDVRKRFKALRALLRLLGSGIGDDGVRCETLLRSMHHRLGSARDHEALCEALAALLDDPAVGARSQGALERLHASLRQASDPVLVGRRLLYEIRPDLAALRGMVVRWRFARADFALVAPGLERTCRQVRRRSRQAQREGTDERCHDWRKSLKYLWFQLYVFEPVVGGSELIEACRRAATDLGADHDHALLAGLAPAHLDPVAAQRAVAVLQAAGARRRADAVATARPICAMAPMELSARIRRAWAARAIALGE